MLSIFVPLMYTYKSSQKEADKVDIVPNEIQSADAMKQALAGARILLVEDNDINQLLGRKILAKAGFEVTVAANGQEAVDMVKAAPFDLVLMDIQMPVMDGLTAAALIRENPQLAELPIVAMTANDLASDVEQCLAAGMNAHISKPFDHDELFRCLAQWIRRR